MAVWAEIDRKIAEARVKELRPRIQTNPGARAEFARLRALLDGDEDNWYIRKWRSRLH